MAKADPTVAESSRNDANQQFTLIGVQGTLGTADIAGTARTMTFSGDPTTGALYVNNLGASGTGGGGGTVVQIAGGTLQSGTTIAQTLNLLGTITANGQSVFSQDVSGYRAASFVIAGTWSGNIQSQMSMDAGTYYVANFMDAQDPNNYSHDFGDSRIWYGPLSARYLRFTSTSFNSGTAIIELQLTAQGNNAIIGKNAQIKDSNGNNIASNGTSLFTAVSSGTQQTLGTVGVVNNIVTGTIAAVTTVTTVSNLTNGSVNLLTGTVTSVTNLAGGTVQINPVPVPATLQFGTLGTAGGSFFGTLSAASGAGTKHYITGYSIVMNSGTADVRILAGTAIQGTGVIVGGAYPAGGGNSKIIEPAFATGTNSELIYHFVGAGTAFITISYWKAP